jgi:NAD(P)-dependent dehydrogenase (short-subunit alcohol dehydrogenase family)
MDGKYKGKVAVITGGTSGIGEATAKLLAGEGASVIIAGSSKEKGQRACGEILKTGYKVDFVQTDVSNAKSVEALINYAVNTYHKLDFAINNAAIDHEPTPMQNITEEDWDRVLNVNLKGVWLGMKYELIQMLKQGFGSIVNVSSQGGLVAAPFIGAYAASKGGILQLTRTGALENGTSKIRINAVCPGSTQTPFLDQALAKHPEMKGRMTGAIPMQRVGTAEEIANAIIWLCSDEASYITGICLPVDGGVTAG